MSQTISLSSGDGEASSLTDFANSIQTHKDIAILRRKEYLISLELFHREVQRKQIN